MPRGLWHRIGSALIALCYVMRMTEPAPLRVCPMHGAAAAVTETASGQAGHAGHHMGDPHAGHDMSDPHANHADHAGNADHGSPHDHGPDSTHGCACAAACGASMGIVPTAPTLSLVDVIAEVVPAPGRPYHEFVAAWVDFVLPFANAPPRVTMA